MPSLFITGGNSSIIKELLPILPSLTITDFNRNVCDLSKLDDIKKYSEIIQNHQYYVLAHGMLSNKHYKQQSEEEILTCMKVNLLSTLHLIEIALENPNAKIIVIGSESGLKSSYDLCYGMSKAAIHKYVEEKRLKPNQQLVCIAPSLIEDSRMTQRRQDQNNVLKAIENHPKKRGLTALEVAEMIYFLLFVDKGYITNTVIHMNGGKYARA